MNESLEKSNLNQKTSVILSLPVLIFIGTACIIRLKVVPDDVGNYYWSGGTSPFENYFTFYKMIFVCFCAILAIVLLIIYLKKDVIQLKKTYIYYAMAVFIFFVLISFIFSDHKGVALLGLSAWFEGTITICCYMIMLFYTINIVNNEFTIKAIVYFLGVICLFLGILGVLQMNGWDPFTTEIGQKLITPNYTTDYGENSWSEIEKLAKEGTVIPYLAYYLEKPLYWTLGFAEFVAQYLSMVVPMFGVLFLLDTSRYRKLIWLLLFTLLLYNAISTNSANCLIGFIISAFICIVYLNKRLLKYKWSFLVLAILICFMFVLCKDSLDSDFKSIPKKLFKDNKQVNATINNQNKDNKEESITILDSLETSGRDLIITVDNTNVTIKFYEGKINILNHENKNVGIEHKDYYLIDDKKFKKISIAKPNADNNIYTLRVQGEEREWPFTLKNNTVYYVNDYNNLVELTPVSSFGFEDNVHFGSGRGYIWSRTIPLLKNNIIIGNGANTTIFYFPHNDYLSLYKIYGNEINTVYWHPHNMLMEGIMNYGLLAMIGWFVMLGIYVIQGLVIYRRNNFNDFTSIVGIAILIGTCSFVSSLQLNTTNIGFMTMFYSLFGLGIGINLIVKKRIPKCEKTNK